MIDYSCIYKLHRVGHLCIRYLDKQAFLGKNWPFLLISTNKYMCIVVGFHLNFFAKTLPI